MRGQGHQTPVFPVVGLAMVVGLALLVVALSGCGGTSSSSGANSNAGTASTNSGTVVYGYWEPPADDWDPSLEEGTAVAMCNVYETLLTFDANTNTFLPDLATSYSHSTNGLIWTFHIRKGVKFHDGTPVDAAAVKFSIDRTRKLGKGVSYIWASVSRIEVKDPQTVVFRLSYPAPLDLVASATFGAYIMSPTAVTSHPAGWLTAGHDAGSGPYELVTWQQGQQAILRKFSDYWGGWSGKHFSAVVIQTVTEPSVRRLQLEGGQSDVTTYLPPRDVSALATNSRVRIINRPGFTNYTLMLNTLKPPLNNLKVRKALAYAFPYEAVVQTAGAGLAQRAYSVVPAGLWGRNAKAFTYSTDLTKAKALLAEAGYPNGGFQLTYAYSSSDDLEKRIGELYAASLSQLNVQLKTRGMPWESLYTLATASNPRGSQDIACLQWWPTIVSPADFLYNLLVDQNPVQYNWSYWKNSTFDKLVTEGTTFSASDRALASKCFQQAQALIGPNVPVIPVLDIHQVFAMAKSLKGFVYNPTNSADVLFYHCWRQ